MKSMLAAAAIILLAGTVQAEPIPPYAAAAVADKGRPAEDVARDVDRKPAEMVAFAGIKPGDKVVDLMPGKGYFTRIFARAVGPSGHVYAYIPSEIDAAMKKRNIPIPSGTDPNYPNVSYLHNSLAAFATPEQVDLVWTSQNYHDFHNPSFGPANLAVLNKAIYQSLKPGGTYIVLDHAAAAGSGLRDTNTLHRIDPAAVKQEVMAAGFRFEGESEALKNPADSHDKAVFDPSIRGKTDQFVFKFRKPAS